MQESVYIQQIKIEELKCSVASCLQLTFKSSEKFEWNHTSILHMIF